MKIRSTVNGVSQEVEVPPSRRLIDFLRYDLGLTGTKEGCSVGVCGACTVLLNGKIVSSCLALAVFADGGEVTTVEGLAHDERLHPVQQAFIDTGAVQCGYCTPGFIVSVKALFDRTRHPTPEEIEEAVSGNICRCTGYAKIVDAVQLAAERLEGRS